jgi:hypothetical protein
MAAIFAIGAAVAALSLPSATAARAALPPAEGNLIKAGVVYNLLKYTHWTGGKTQGDLALCYIGGDALGDALEVLEGRTAQRMTIRIRDLADGDSLLGCHVAIINDMDDESLSRRLAALKGSDTLTVSSIKGFAASGGMVEFTDDGGHVGFTLNQPLIAAARLRMDAALVDLSARRRT